METHKSNWRQREYAAQSRVISHGPRNAPRWSLHLMRSRSKHGEQYGKPEKRGFTVFVTTPWLRFEIGTR
jgi:hypothetical protein